MTELSADFEKELKEKQGNLIHKRWVEKLTVLIRLRWIAAAGLFSTISFSFFLLKLDLPVIQLYIGNAVLIFANVLFMHENRRLKHNLMLNPRYQKNVNMTANIQIGLDWGLLTYLLHFSGGIENPFIFFFIFHMITASLLLSNKNAFIHAAVLNLLTGLGFVGEITGFLKHHHLSRFALFEICTSPDERLVGFFISFIATIFITTYLAISIVNRLRHEEDEVVLANVKLNRKDRLQSEYVRRVSHDIQGSLAAIQSCLNVVTSNFSGDIETRTREMVERAEERSDGLLHFVKNLLVLLEKRTEQDALPDAISPAPLMREIEKRFKPLIEGKELSLILEIPKDEIRAHITILDLQLVLENLIGNAIIYTPWGGQIWEIFQF